VQYENNVADNMRVGGGAGSSSMPPVVLAVLLLAILLIWVLPRKYVVVPFLLTVFLTPFGLQLYIAGVHLFVFRILILCGWARIAVSKKSSKNELTAGGFTSIDKIFVYWAIFRAVATFLEFVNVSAVINQCGFLIDALGGYFLLRFLIRDEEDIARVIKIFALIVSVLSVTMIVERVHASNVFGYLGGRFAPFIRDGAIRAQGSFTGPIPAGTFGATLFCLFAWLWYSGRSRSLGIAGMLGSAVMVVTSASSTPTLALPAGILGICMWPARKSMRMVRWGLVIVLISLHLVMKAPVWMLINHIDLIGGNSGYHRAMLIDMCVRHFWDWWLIGVESTKYWGWDMWDQANQYVAEAETGGLATFICFVLLISRCFGYLGTARRLSGPSRKQSWMFWLLGSALFSHVVSFFGISFSDQSVFAWYALIAIIVIATVPVLAEGRTNGEPLSATSAGPQLAYTPSVNDTTVRDEVPDWSVSKRTKFAEL